MADTADSEAHLERLALDDPAQGDTPDGHDADHHADHAKGLSKMTVEEMRAELAHAKLSSAGNRDTLKARLKAHRQRQHALQKQAKLDALHGPAHVTESSEDGEPRSFVMVFDVEATCDEIYTFGYMNEIIELPCCLLDGCTGEMIGEFHTFVRPTLRPVLSDYCKNLTGVTQADVDAAPTWPVALDKLVAWLHSHGALSESDLSEDPAQPPPARRRSRLVVASDGPWDTRDFVRKACSIARTDSPPFLHAFCDLRKWMLRTVAKHEAYRAHPLAAKHRRGGHHGSPARGPMGASPFAGRTYTGAGLVDLVRFCGLAFEGREHCGRDDTRNLARAVQVLIRDGGYRLGPNWRRVAKGEREVAAIAEANARQVAAVAQQTAAGDNEESGGGGAPAADAVEAAVAEPSEFGDVVGRGGAWCGQRRWACGDEVWQWFDVGADGEPWAPSSTRRRQQ